MTNRFIQQIVLFQELTHGLWNINSNNLCIEAQARETIHDEFLNAKIFGHSNIPEPVTKNVSAISGSRLAVTISNKPVEISIDHKLRAMDSRKLRVQPSNETKKYFCGYCKKVVVKLPRHLEQMHQDEDDVQKLRSATGTFILLLHISNQF